MDILSILHLPATTIITYAIPFLVALTLIVFVHEYGHFKIARLCGVKVDTFAIGFGRELWGRNDRHGTRWKIGWLPLGGYVKFAGDANAASLPQAASSDHPPRAGDFPTKPLWQRALVVAAGPVANFLLAIAIFAASYALIGLPASEPRVDGVIVGGAADKAGIKSGDFIRAINGARIDRFQDIQDIVTTHAGESLSILLDRNGAAITIVAVPEAIEQSDGFGGKIRLGRLGIQNNGSSLIYDKKSVGESLRLGVDRTWFIVETTFRYLGKLFLGQESPNQLGGFISIAKAAGDAASVGIAQFIFVVGLLSVSIGLINLFPIPMLDGGHLVYYAIEAIRGKPLGPEAQEWGFKIGFTVVLTLMLVGTWNDLMRLVAPVQ
jgi:regulator of sigma E protease